MSDDLLQYIYVLAGGKTLDVINHVKQQAEKAKEAIQTFAAKHGIAALFPDGRPDPVFIYDPLEAAPAPGWRRVGNDGRYDPIPDESYVPNDVTPEGQALQKELEIPVYAYDAQSRFHELCLNLIPQHYSEQGRSYEFYEFGDNVVVRCPISRYENKDGSGRNCYIPPDSKQITPREYVEMKLAAETSPAHKIMDFRRNLEQLTLLQKGSIVYAKTSRMEFHAGMMGVCYNIKMVEGRPVYCIIFQNGMHDSFHASNVDTQLTVHNRVDAAAANYKFTDEQRLSADFQSGYFNSAFNINKPPALRLI